MSSCADRSLSRLLNPRSVAIVGASRSPEKYGYLVPRYLIEEGYQGKIFLVNPRDGEALGRRFYASLKDIDQPIDLVVSVLPPSKTAAVVQDAVSIEAGGVVLLSAGFAESGPAGTEAQNAITRIALEGGVRLVGPNCLGLFNASSRLNVMTNPDIPLGPIALITQSGGLAEMFFHEARRLGSGFSLCVSVGNQADVRLEEAIEYAAADPSTKVIAVYVEGVPDGRGFIESVAAAARLKPVVVIKGGRGKAGSRATVSHTASIAGSANVYQALLQNAGAVVVQSLTDFYPVALTLALAPPLGGPNIALLGGGGGQGTVMADVVEGMGLQAPALPDDIQQRLLAMLSERANISNPVEFAGATEESFSVYEKCAEVILGCSAVDGLVMFGSFGGFRLELETEEGNYVKSAHALGELSRRFNKPLIMQTYFAGGAQPAFEALREEQIPCFASPETAARCMTALADARGLLNTTDQPDLAPTQPEASSSVLVGFEEAQALAEAKGLDVVPMTAVSGFDDAFAATKQIGFPVVVKLLEPQLAHKSDAGGVVTNLGNESELQAAIEQILARHSDKQNVLLGVSPMVRSGIEAVVGGVRDPTFGPLVMVGSGGIYLEIYRDVALALAGLSLDQAYRLIESTRLHAVLAGARGGQPLDIRGLATAVIAVSELLLEKPEIMEVDLNPVFVEPDRVRLADLRILKAHSPIKTEIR